VTSTTDQKNGFTLVEVMVVLILLTLSFMVFLRALNTGETIRARSEIRTTQSVILNSLENEIRARRFDENASYPWSSTLGKDTGESQLIQFDDIDDFDGYYISSVSGHPAFSCSVAVNYVSVSSGFHSSQSNQSNFKSVMVKISHATLPAIIDTMVIGSGI
jgi:prepilin-type N-terminal cleavage/methylation domain-containing protein